VDGQVWIPEDTGMSKNLKYCG